MYTSANSATVSSVGSNLAETISSIGSSFMVNHPVEGSLASSMDVNQLGGSTAEQSVCQGSINIGELSHSVMVSVPHQVPSSNHDQHFGGIHTEIIPNPALPGE